MGEVPLTPLGQRYLDLDRPGGTAARLEMARELVANPQVLADEFNESVAAANRFFAGEAELSKTRFYPVDRKLRDELDPGLGSTPALCKWLELQGKRKWEVLGADELSFYYVDRELVSTQAPGHRLEGKRSTADGPRLDLLLANRQGMPIVGEVKLTALGRKRPVPDEDPFYALIQSLASASYLLPEKQFARLAQHDKARRFDSNEPRLGIYLLIGDPPEAGSWFELRELAERLSAALVPRLGDRLPLIAGLELAWFGEHRPVKSRLRITKRFAHEGG